MQVRTRVQIRQYNDPEILEFLNAHAVEYRLIGDHLFIIRGRDGDLAAGPGDWLLLSAAGEIETHRGDYARRARQAILRAKQVHRGRAFDRRATAITMTIGISEP